MNYQWLLLKLTQALSGHVEFIDEIIQFFGDVFKNTIVKKPLFL